jgi:hypothetical protein
MRLQSEVIFQVTFPTHWPDIEKYDFDWAELSRLTDPFQNLTFRTLDKLCRVADLSKPDPLTSRALVCSGGRVTNIETEWAMFA